MVCIWWITIKLSNFNLPCLNLNHKYSAFNKTSLNPSSFRTFSCSKFCFFLSLLLIMTLWLGYATCRESWLGITRKVNNYWPSREKSLCKSNKSTPVEILFCTKHVLSVFIRVDEALSPAVAFLCHYFCGSCLCKYTVCLTQKHLVKFDPLKKKKKSNQGSCVQSVCKHWFLKCVCVLGGFLVGVIEMFDLISVFYIFIIKI